MHKCEQIYEKKHRIEQKKRPKKKEKKIQEKNIFPVCVCVSVQK